MQPGSGKAISLFDADPELVRYVDAVHVEAAWSRAVAAVAILRPGDVSPRDWVEVSDGHLGLLVLDGLLTRNVTLLGRTALDLVGSEDLIRPWEDATEHSSVPRSVTWTVHRRTSVAVLDQGFVERVAPWPGIVAALLSRSLTRARWLGFHLATLENPRVDVRLMLLFWELAD